MGGWRAHRWCTNQMEEGIRLLGLVCILGDTDVQMASVIQHVVLNESVEVVKIVVNLSISPKTLS